MEIAQTAAYISTVIFWIGLLAYVLFVYEPRRHQERLEEFRLKDEWTKLSHKALDLQDVHHRGHVEILERWASSARRTETKIDVILTEMIRTNPSLKPIIESIDGD